MDTCTVRILSSAAWNGTGRGGLVLTPNMFMFQNPSYGSSEVFVPREFEWRKGDVRTGAPLAPTRRRSCERILEEIAGYEGSTRTALCHSSRRSSPGPPGEDFDKLQREGTSRLAAGEVREDYPRLSLTEKGRTFLERSR